MILVNIRCAECRRVLHSIQSIHELTDDEILVFACRRCWGSRGSGGFLGLVNRSRRAGLDLPPLQIGVPCNDLRSLAASAWRAGKTRDYAL